MNSYTAGNGIQTTVTYDPLRYWVRGISAGTMQFSYDDYDPVGNVHTITDSRPGGMTQQFTYDELDRLKTVVGPLSEVFEYDVHGNRTDANGATYQYESGTLRLANRNGIAYGYDANGNLQSAGPNTFTYTPENWLVTATLPGSTRTYAYDNDGWRSKRVTPGEAMFYTRGLANEVLTEWHVSSATPWARDYIYAGGRVIAAVSHNSPFPTMCGGTVGPDGTPQTLSVASGNTGIVTFEGSACRRVSAKATVTAGNFLCAWTLGVNPPVGAMLPGYGASCGATLFMEPVVLPMSGQYSAVVDPAGTGSGTVRVELFDVVDVTGSITTDGTAVAKSIGTPGQRALLTFTGVAGSKVSVAETISTGTCATIRILNPNMAVALDTLACGSGFQDPVQLPIDGVYTLSLDPSSDSLPTVTARVWAVTDHIGSIEVGGQPVSIPLNTPGQKARLTFQGTQGWRVSATETVSSGCAFVRIYKPDMSLLSNTVACTPGVSFQEAVTLPSTGTYTLELDPQSNATLTVTAQLYQVVDYTGSISVGGSAVTVPLPTPGQVGMLTMQGTLGQQVTVRLTGNSFSSVNVKLLKSDNTLVAQTTGYTTNFNMSTQTLPATDAYTVRLDPGSYSTGGITVTVTSP